MNIIFVQALIALSLVIAVVGIAIFKYRKFSSTFPEEARIKNLKQRYADLIDNLNKAIALSDSPFSLAKELEKVQYPDDTLSVSMNKDSNNKLSIFNHFQPRKSSGYGNSFSETLNGGGYGETNGQQYLILNHPIGKYEYEHIEILIGRASSATR